MVLLVVLGMTLSARTEQGRDEDLNAPATASAARMTANWYDVVSRRPGPDVTDLTMRQAIDDSGLPWKVRDRATGIDMVLVLPGEFLMGSPESEPGRREDEGPQHRVRLTKAFYLGATEVTQAQWRNLTAPSHQTDQRRRLGSFCLVAWRHGGFERTPGFWWFPVRAHLGALLQIFLLSGQAFSRAIRRLELLVGEGALVYGPARMRRSKACAKTVSAGCALARETQTRLTLIRTRAPILRRRVRMVPQ